MWWKPWPPMRKEGAILGTALCAGALGAVGSGVEGSCSAPRPGLSLSVSAPRRGDAEVLGSGRAAVRLCLWTL